MTSWGGPRHDVARTPRPAPRPRTSGAAHDDHPRHRRQHGGPVAPGSRTWWVNAAPNSLSRARVAPCSRPGRRMRRSITYNLVIHTQATDAATLARDLVPYLSQADLTSRRFSG